MAIKNKGLGGTDWISGEALVYTDMNDTFNATYSGKRPVISITENMIQTTKLSSDATVIDIERSNALVDVFTDSGGYNNTLNTGGSNAVYDATNDNYKCQTTDATATPETSPGSATRDSWESTITTTISVVEPGFISEVQVSSGSSSQNITVSIKEGSTVIATQTQNTPGTSIVTFTFVRADYASILEPSTSYTILMSSTQPFLGKKASVSFSGTNFTYTTQYIPGYTGAFDFITFTPMAYSNSILLTTSKTFAFNLASCLVNAETTTPTDTAITVDVSSDGGSTYDVTGQSLREVLSLDNDDTDLVFKFNLTTTSYDATPTISSFGAQLF